MAMQSNAQEAYTMTVESNPAAVEGMTTYRFYVNMLDESDRLSAIYGNNEQGMALDAPSGVYNNAFNTTWNASGVNPLMLEMFPELVADTYATIGLEGRQAHLACPTPRTLLWWKTAPSRFLHFSKTTEKRKSSRTPWWVRLGSC